jgi:hypothetical protein
MSMPETSELMTISHPKSDRATFPFSLRAKVVAGTRGLQSVTF